MNDRPTASTITDAQLDELYDELTALRQVARGYCPTCGRGDAAPTVTDWEQQRQRAKQAESALTRVRKACDSVRAADQGHNPAVDWVVMRVLEAIDARLVSGGLPPVPNGSATPCPACARADQAGLAPGEQHPTCASVEAEAIRQLDADPHGLKAGMIVQSYREYGQEKWVFRCWGTDTCPGLVSLDHFSEQAAERARDRHLAEEHTGRSKERP